MGVAPQLNCPTADQAYGSYSVPRRPANRQIWNGKSKPPNGAEPNAELWVEVMVRQETSIVSPTQLKPRRFRMAGLFFESNESPHAGAQAAVEDAAGITRMSAFGAIADIGRCILPIIPTLVTQSGHRLDRNPAAQQSPAVPRCASLWSRSTAGPAASTSIQNDSGLAQGLAGCCAAG